MDLALFRRRPFSSAVIGAVVVFVALNATLLLGTFYLQHSRGMSPALAGAITLPMAVCGNGLRAVVRNNSSDASARGGRC